MQDNKMKRIDRFRVDFHVDVKLEVYRTMGDNALVIAFRKPYGYKATVQYMIGIRRIGV